MSEPSSTLAGTTWALRGLHDPSASIGGTPTGEEILTFGPDSVHDNHGNSASARIGASTIVFGLWINGLVGRFGGPDSASLNIEEERFLFTVLQGDTTWTMTGQELLIENHETGSVSLSAFGSSVP